MPAYVRHSSGSRDTMFKTGIVPTLNVAHLYERGLRQMPQENNYKQVNSMDEIYTINLVEFRKSGRTL